ncbi:MAG: hypothetical protein WCA08_25985 [Desulfoferrobacter sp.]
MTHNLSRACIEAVFVLFLTIAFSLPVSAQQSPPPSGTVTINEYELAYIFNGQLGGGKLNFQGNTYDFKLGGLGIGGIGASHIQASGEVYNLNNVSQFPGTYLQGSLGYSATNQGKGDLWLQNENGVVLHLKTSQQGLGLTTGADGIVVNMN